MTDMRHLEHLQAVADSDVAVLRTKEATYQGSWKAAGGRSAWFMARRNLDRLLVMMADVPWPESFSMEDLREAARPEHRRSGGGDYELTPELAAWLVEKLSAEDIFEKIANDPTGADGTVLAVLRDARRYFTLVEAEMIARGVVEPEAKVQKQGCWSDNLTDRQISNVLHGRDKDNNGEFTAAAMAAREGLPPAERVASKDPNLSAPYGTAPEDGGIATAAPCAPWVLHTIDGPPNPVYQNWSKDTWYMRPFLSYPEEYRYTASAAKEFGNTNLMSFYRNDPDARGWVLDRSRVPARWAFLWPTLQAERNTKEWEDLRDWRKHLYAWQEDGQKWVIKPEYAAWRV